jgi:hypothetical protein
VARQHNEGGAGAGGALPPLEREMSGRAFRVPGVVVGGGGGGGGGEIMNPGFTPQTPRVPLPVVATISMPARLVSMGASSSPGHMAATAARPTAFTPLGSRMGASLGASSSRMGASLGASSSPASITAMTPLGSTWLLLACTPDPLEQDMVPQDGAAGAGREERQREEERGRESWAEREGGTKGESDRERGDGAAGGGEALRSALRALDINNASVSGEKKDCVRSGMLL